MHHARLHDRARPDRPDRLGQALEAVADQHQHVGDAAVLQLGQHVQPVLGALTAVTGPDHEDVAVAVDGDRHGQVDRPVRDLTVADLDVDGVDEHDRIHPVQGPVLPLRHPVHHLVRDGGYGLFRHVSPVHLGQVSGDLSVGQALGRQRQHHVVNAGQPPLPFAHDLRLESARRIARNPHLDRSDVGEHGLGPAAVTGVPAATAGRIVLVVADVVSDLTVQRRLEDPLRELLQQPTLYRAKTRRTCCELRVLGSG